MTTIAMDSATTATSRTRAGRPRFWLIGTVAGAFLGLVLLVAVWAKALDPLAFAEQIRTEKLDFLLSAQAVALIALALEAGLGLALLLGLRRTWILVPATLLVAFFLFLTGRTYWLDSQGLLDEKAAASCGCFGNLVQRSPAEAFWQDLLMLVPPLALAFVGRDRRSRRFPPVRTVVVAAAALGAALFAWKAPVLPLDDLATRLKPDVKVAELCVGGDEETAPVCLDTVAPYLAQGEHLVVMANLDDPKLAEAVDAMNEYARRPDNPRLAVLSPSSAEQHHAFFWQWGPVFQVVEAPAPLLRPLYRTLPRAFLVRDGKVTRTFSALPPLFKNAAGERTTATTATTAQGPA